ncbi:hypothetical protein L3X38_011183 [Prunus dulcis]|uniref:Reverse transcriptase domain-containing protein n=1 Tax=Prunus dulcis TaxID=3755 RepID=A0AAD4WJP7_PRUDU|nr:hypothetical protein L3X38_011183 [Prunus dulcis]
MPFGLKNVGATYQRLVNKIFKEQIGKTMEVYVDDMLVKVPKRADHIENLASHSACSAIALHDERDSKSDGQSSGPQPIPIEINRQVQTTLQSFEERTKRQMGLGVRSSFPESEDLPHLTSPPLLSKPVPSEDLFAYLAVSNSTVRSALIREELGAQHPVFYTSKALLDAETR